MVRSSVIIALVLAAAVAVASAQPPAPAFSMVFNKPTKGARPLPGTLNGAEMTYMQVMLRIVFEGQLTIGNPAADPAAREALLAAALTVVADASAAAQAVAGSDPFAGWELTLRPPVMYQNNEGEKELMLIGKLYRDDGADFPKEAEDALRAPFDYYASTKMNLANDATNNIGMSGVYIKEDNGMAAAYVLDYVHEGEPMPRPPTARALFDGKLISNSAVDLAMLQNVMPLVLSGCLTPLDLGLNPTNFYLLGGISYPSDEGMVTLFRASIELRTENYRDVAMGLYMALEMCVANQLGGATGGAMAWASAPLPSAFVGESRYGNKDDGGTVAFYLEQTQEQYDEVLDNFEVMYVAAQQALNAVLEWGVMSQNRDPYGARANISNFDIGAHGHFMFPDGPRSGFLLRASGMRNVDFPETSDMLWQVMGNAITEFLGMVDMIEGEAHVAPFGMTDEEQYRNDNNNNNGGDNEDDPFVALLVSLEITAATGTENTWKWAETRAKAAVIFYLINSLEDTDGDMGRNVEVGTDIQITTLDMMTFTYSTYIRASSKEVAEAIRENINDNADALEGLLGGGHTASVRSVRGLGRPYQMDGRPSHHGLNRLVGVLGFSGLKVQHADTDVFNGALAEAIAMSTESPKDNAAVVGCVGTDKNEFVCQIELAVPSAPTTTAEYMAMLSMFGDLPAAVETIMQPIWGSEFSVTAECDHCMAAFRPAWFDDDNLKLEFRYWDNFRVNGMDMRGNAGAGNLRTLYGLALLKSLEEATGEEFGLGNFVLEDGNDGARVQFSDLEDDKRNAIESNYGEIANLIAKYLKAWGGLDVSPRFDNGGGNGGNDNCIPHVFRYDRGDGSMVQVATNNCYSMFPSDQCDNANTIDDGRGNTYWLMGSWDNYANLQVCN